MKKILLLMLLPVLLWSCSSDDEPKGEKFTSGVSEVMQVLKGQWKSQTTETVLTFTNYSEPTEVKPANNSWSSMWMYGEMVRNFDYLGTPETEKYYYVVNVEKKQIHGYGITDSGTYTIVTAKSYDYEIINNSTIRLHDTSLSWLNENVFTKQ